MTRSMRRSHLLAGVVVPIIVLLLAIGPVRAAGAAEPPVVGGRGEEVDTGPGGGPGDTTSTVDDDRRVVSFTHPVEEGAATLTIEAGVTALVVGFAVHLLVRRSLRDLREHGRFGRPSRMAP
jgi:hypothetical protein